MAAATQPSVSVVHADAPSAVVAFASARAREALARLGAAKHKELAEDVKRAMEGAFPGLWHVVAGAWPACARARVHVLRRTRGEERGRRMALHPRSRRAPRVPRAGAAFGLSVSHETHALLLLRIDATHVLVFQSVDEASLLRASGGGGGATAVGASTAAKDARPRGDDDEEA